MAQIGDWVIPSIVFLTVITGYIKGVDVFSEFVAGAKSGIATAFRIIPSLVALIVAVGVFSASGALDLLTCALEPLTSMVGLPSPVVPLALLRPISGGGAMAILTDILSRYGPDSIIGRMASVMEGSSETTFYTIAVYFGATSIKNTRHTLAASLTADITGFLASAFFVRLLFYS